MYIDLPVLKRLTASFIFVVKFEHGNFARRPKNSVIWKRMLQALSLFRWKGFNSKRWTISSLGKTRAVQQQNLSQEPRHLFNRR